MIQYFNNCILTLFYNDFVKVNGSGANILKIGSKRRRTKHEIIEEKEETRLKEEAIQAKLAQVLTMTM